MIIKPDTFISSNDVLESGTKLIKDVYPFWRYKEIICFAFDEGNTNQVFGFYTTEEKNEKFKKIIILKVFGDQTDVIIDRKFELEAMKKCSDLKLGAELYCQFGNGLLYEFFHGDILNDVTVRDPHIAYLIAKKIGELHALYPVDEKDFPELPTIYQRIHDWIENELHDLQYFELTNSRIGEMSVSYTSLRDEILFIKSNLNKTNIKSPMVFSHNDLVVKNIVYNKEMDKLDFIDLEYGGYHFSAYDVGNHFAELARNDPFAFPKEPEQKRFIRTYLTTFNSLRNLPAPTKNDIHKFYLEANKMTLVGHFFWGVWAVVQNQISTIDYSYKQFADEKLSEYFNRKTELMSLK